MNQPRLTTDEDNLLATHHAADGMEMTFVTDGDGHTKLVRADSAVSLCHILRYLRFKQLKFTSFEKQVLAYCKTL